MKNILVTGMSRGIGRETTKVLVDEGYFVYGVYNTNKSEAEKIKKELNNVEIFQCDFSDRGNTLSLISKLKDVKFYGIVNSAGVFLDIDFDDFNMKAWEDTFEVNVCAPLLLVQGLRKNLEDGGSIVNISSTDGMVGSTSGLAYAASKAALISLTQSIAIIFASRKIRVNNIAPGWIGDGMQAPKELLKEAAKLNPLKRTGTYKEIANVVIFLLSEKASYVNGTTVVVDGGDMATNYILQKESEILKDQS